MDWRTVLLNSTLLTVAVVYGLLFAIAQTAGLFGIWLGILVLLSLWRFCYAVLRAVAQGRAPAPPSIDTMNPVNELPVLLHFMVFPGLAVGYAFSILLSPTQSLGNWGVVGGLLLLAIFPASAGLMALTGSLLLSLSPRRIVGFARTLGPRYLMLLAVAVAVWFVNAMLDGFANSPVIGSLWLSWVVTIWGLLVFFGLIGAAIFAHQEVFDIPGMVEAKIVRQSRWNREDQIDAWRRVLDTVYANWRSGQQQEAVVALRKLLEREQHGGHLLAWLFEETVTWEDKHCALLIAREFVRRLLEDGKESDAFAVALRCRGFNEAPRLSPGDAARLAAYAHGNGQSGLADEIASWE